MDRIHELLKRNLQEVFGEGDPSQVIHFYASANRALNRGALSAVLGPGSRDTISRIMAVANIYDALISK